MATKKKANALETETVSNGAQELVPVEGQGDAPARKRNNFMQNNRFAHNPEETRAKLRRCIKIGTMPRVDTNNAEEIEDRVLDYFRSCIEDGTYATISGLACALGIDRLTLRHWYTGAVHKPKAIKDIVSSAYAIINMQYEEMMQEGKMHPLAGMFLMRNNLGYANNDDPLDAKDTREERTPEEIRQKYSKLIE